MVLNLLIVQIFRCCFAACAAVVVGGTFFFFFTLVSSELDFNPTALLKAEAAA